MSKRVQKASAPNRRVKIAGIAAACVAVVLVVAFAAAAVTLLRGNDIYQGVKIGTVEVGGMSRREAEALVEAQYGGSAAAQDLVIKVGDKSFTLSAEECPVHYDTQRAVTRAYSYGRVGNIFRRVMDAWKARVGKGVVELPLLVDDATLRNQMGAIAQAVKVDYRPSGYTYENGELKVDKGAAGYGVDAGKLEETVRDHLMLGKTEAVEVPLGMEQPQPLDWEALAALVKSDIREPSLDLERDPSGNTILPGQPGCTLDVAAAKAAVEAAEGPVAIPLKKIQPQMTDEDFKALIFRDVLGTCTTSLATSSSSRTVNVKLAADFCNNTVLMPGDIFSYNTVVGPRTAERGFKEASVFVGSAVQNGLGGGICQTSSTLYMATVFADLEIIERRNHSRDVLYTPDGQDATVVWGNTDYRFRNNTEYPVRVRAAVTGSGKNKVVTVTIYGTQTVPGKEVKMETEILTWNPAKPKAEILDTSLAPGTRKESGVWYHGYTSQTYRVTYINGVEVSRVKEAYSKYTRYDGTVTIRYNPAVETPDPGAGGETVDPGTGTPGTENPGSGTENPGTGTENPGTGTENPGTGTENPGTGTENSGGGEPDPV